jgi:hypothetical protein
LKNIVEHLQAGLLGWLTGGLGIKQEINLESPQSIFSLALGLLGVNWNYIRQKAVKHKKIGEAKVKRLETSFELSKTLKDKGVVRLWQQIQNTIGDFKQIVIEKIKNLLITDVITKAVQQLLSTIAPPGTIVKLAETCYKGVSFLIEKATKIIEVANTAIGAVNKVASGKVTDAANSVETALVQSIPVLLGFFARLVGIENLGIKVKEWLSRLKARIDNFIDTLLNQAVNWLSKFPKGTKTGKPKPPSNNNTTASPSNQPDYDNKVRVGLAQIDKKETTYLRKNIFKEWQDLEEICPGGREKVTKHNPIFKSITVVYGGETWDYDWVASNGTKKREKQAEKAQNDSGIIESDTRPSLPDYKHIFYHGTIEPTAGKLKK